MFAFLKEKLKKIYTQVTAPLAALFSRARIDEDMLTELEQLLLQADTGVKTTRACITHLREKMRDGSIVTGADARTALADHLLSILRRSTYKKTPRVYVMVGVNGTGKTTCAAKLAALHMARDKKVLLAAADTFRAAATEQLAIWAQRTNADIVTGTPEQDPASVVFAACQKCIRESYDILIIDTAGRLQNKTNLMNELEKISRVVAKFFPSPDDVATLVTIDALLGQNSAEQARLFNRAVRLDGIILTKTDGTGKGGIMFALSEELALPVVYMSFGEGIDDLAVFSPDEYIQKFFAG